MRGKLAQCAPETCENRITPADAGKTIIPTVYYELYKDHPRGCGENLYFASVSAQNSGSPPRMRGKHEPCGNKAKRAGITPADAGKTGATKLQIGTLTDHPRGCGENQSSPNPAHNNIGSPPRMRGKPKRLMVDSFGDRITPADAGKTFHLGELIQSFQDHPRGCGENIGKPSNPSKFLGSPPRMRGKRPDKAQYQKEDRITPADAGKT